MVAVSNVTIARMGGIVFGSKVSFSHASDAIPPVAQLTTTSILPVAHVDQHIWKRGWPKHPIMNMD